MASNNYTSQVLLGVLRSLKRPKRHMLDRYFARVVESDKEEISFDVKIGARRVAPFVSPDSAGQVVKALGYETMTFHPAYLKPKSPLKPSAALKRAAGETIGGGDFTAAQRRDMLVADILFDQADQIIRRQELMAAEAMVTGKVTVAGENYQTRIVDYGRSADLTIQLTGTDRWNQATATPVDDVEEWIELVHELEGASIFDVTMDPVAWKWFKRSKQAMEILDNRRAAGANSAELGGLDLASGAKFGGNFGTFNVWIYSEYYLDPVDGVQKPLLPAGTVVAGSPDGEGMRTYGAILDDQNLHPMEMWPKSWLQDDPSLRFIMTQSAPLPVLGRPNATFAAKVLNDE